MVTNIRLGAPQRPAVAGCSTGQLTAGSLGALLSAYPIPLYGELLMWRRTTTSLSVPAMGSSFWCIRSSNANQPGTPAFDQVTTVNMGGSLIFGSINPDGLTGQI